MVLHLGLLSNCFGSSIKGSLWTQSGIICSCARDLGLITVFMTSSVHLLFACGGAFFWIYNAWGRLSSIV
jgi:hypothetical protein